MGLSCKFSPNPIHWLPVAVATKWNVALHVACQISRSGLPEQGKLRGRRAGAGNILYLESTRWCPSSLAKLVQITPLTMVYGRYNYSIHGVYKPTYNWGAPPCTWNLFYSVGSNSPISSPFGNQHESTGSTSERLFWAPKKEELGQKMRSVDSRMMPAMFFRRCFFLKTKGPLDPMDNDNLPFHKI